MGTNMLRLTNTFGIVLLLVSISLAGSPASRDDSSSFKPGLSIRLMGGANYLAVGDLNTFVTSFDSFLKAGLADYPGGKSRPIGHFQPSAGAELQWNFSPRLAISIGSGYLYGKAASNFETSGFFPMTVPDSVWLWHVSWAQNVKAVPLTVSVYYSLPIVPRVSIFLNGGAGAYFSSGYLLRRIELHSGDIFQDSGVIFDEYRVHKTGLGAHGGVGFEFHVNRFLAVALEAKGRYIRIGDLQASRNHSDFNGGSIEDGILYFGTRDLTSEGLTPNTPELAIGPSPGLRKATLDFSGFSLTAGIRLRLF